MLANRVRMGASGTELLLFGAPILAEEGAFLDKWTASSIGTGVAEVYDDMLYLSVSNYANVGDSATFLSDPVKVSSEALSWTMGMRGSLGGEQYDSTSVTQYLHGIPIDTIIKIGITLTCKRDWMDLFEGESYELSLSIMDKDGEPLVNHLLIPHTFDAIASIDSLKFT